MVDTGIKCAIILEDKSKIEFMRMELESVDGDPISKNELLVDIGRDPWPHAWPKSITTFTHSFKNFTPDLADRYQQQRVFSTTFRTIGLAIKRKFHFVRTPATHTHFRDEFTEDISVFNDRPSVIAQQYLYHPRNSKEFNGLGQWNDNHFFTPFGDALPAHMIDAEHYTEGETFNDGRLKTLGSIAMLHVNMHEKGHGMGYYHDTVHRESILWPFAKRGYTENRKWFPSAAATEGTVNKGAFIWTNDDLARWHEKYEKRFLPMWLINILQKRRVRGRFINSVPYRIAV